MTLRNFWLHGLIDGRRTDLTGGPRSKDGGFDLTIAVRDGNVSMTALRIRGHAARDGKLTIRVEPGRSLASRGNVDGAPIMIETQR